MVISFISNVDDLVEETSAEVGVVCGSLGRFVGAHLAAADDSLLNDGLGSLLHSLEHLFLLLFGELLVQLTSSFVLAFTELTVFGNHLLALVGAPDLVIELLLLVALVLDKLDNHGLALLKLKLLHVFFLLSNKASAAFLAL